MKFNSKPLNIDIIFKFYLLRKTSANLCKICIMKRSGLEGARCMHRTPSADDKEGRVTPKKGTVKNRYNRNIRTGERRIVASVRMFFKILCWEASFLHPPFFSDFPLLRFWLWLRSFCHFHKTVYSPRRIYLPSVYPLSLPPEVKNQRSLP